MIVKTKTLQVLIACVGLLVFEMAPLGAASLETTNAKTAYDFYLNGNGLYHDEKYDEATRVFEQSVQLNPGYYYARSNLGVAMAKTGAFRKALQQFTFCIEEKYGSDADRFVFYFNRMLAGKESGRTQFIQKDLAALKKLDSARIRELRDSKEYIFMDALYSQTRNAADKDKLFQKHKTSLAKGKIIVRKISGHRGNAEEYEAMGLIEGTLREVSGVLTDYVSYPEFMPNVREISIRSSAEEGFVVDHTLSLPMGVLKKYRLKYWAKSEANSVQLFWKKWPWPELRPSQTIVDTYGQWILEDVPGTDNQVLAYYRVYTDPGKVPFGTGWIVDIVTKESIPNVIRETKRRVKHITKSTKP